MPSPSTADFRSQMSPFSLEAPFSGIASESTLNTSSFPFLFMGVVSLREGSLWSSSPLFNWTEAFAPSVSSSSTSSASTSIISLSSLCMLVFSDSNLFFCSRPSLLKSSSLSSCVSSISPSLSMILSSLLKLSPSPPGSLCPSPL